MAKTKPTKRFCTACGKAVPLNEGGRPRYKRHVYGPIGEARCLDCLERPVVDVETQRTIARMGDVVVAYRLSHGLDVVSDGKGRVTIGGGLP